MEKKQKIRFRFSTTFIKPGTKSDDVYNLQALLSRYGYLRTAYLPGKYDEATRHAVAQFQSFYKIYPDEDGVCDEETVNLLNQPRCGICDHPPAHRSTEGDDGKVIYDDSMVLNEDWPDLPELPKLIDLKQIQVERESCSRRLEAKSKQI